MATKKQKKLAEVIKRNLSKPGKKPTMKKTLKEVGYSDSMAEHPKEVFETKGMKSLLLEMVPEKAAAKLHKELLNMEMLDSFEFKLNVPDAEIKDVIKKLGCRLLAISVIPIFGKKIAYIAVPNGKIRKDGLELYYKVTGSLAPTHIKIDTDPIDDMPESELDDRLEETDELVGRFKKFGAPLLKKKRTKGKK